MSQIDNHNHAHCNKEQISLDTNLALMQIDLMDESKKTIASLHHVQMNACQQRQEIDIRLIQAAYDLSLTNFCKDFFFKLLQTRNSFPDPGNLSSLQKKCVLVFLLH